MTEHSDSHVPPSAPRYECPHCGRPFASEDRRTLHQGLEHASQLDDEKIEQFRDAYRDEEKAVRMFRLKALAALIALYFGLLMIYAVV